MNPSIELPQESLSIGTWALLLELRREFCGKWQPRDPAPFRTLITDSIERWSALYSDEWFRGQFRDGQRIEDFSTLLPYLQSCLAAFDRGDHGWLEKLLVPYIMSIEKSAATGQQIIRWWLPPQSFLDNTQFRQQLYPFLRTAVFERLRLSPGGAQQTPMDQPTTADEWLVRFVSGMRSLQSKLIASFEEMYNPYSRFEDRLVGNGSAYMHVLTNHNNEPVGVFILSSPIFGIFHKLLLQQALPNQPTRPASNFVCCADMTSAEWHQLERLLGDRHVDEVYVPNCAGGRAAVYWFECTSEGESKPRQLFLTLCTGSQDRAGATPSRCVFAGNNDWLQPTAAEFLVGIRKLASRALLDEANSVLATLHHTVSLPLRTAATQLEWAAIHIQSDANEKARGRLGEARTILLQLLETFASLERQRLRQAPSAMVFDLFEVVNEQLRILRQAGFPAVFRMPPAAHAMHTEVRADRGLCQGVIMMALTNAVQATVASGRRSPIVLKAFRKGDAIVLTISNRAEGLAPAFFADLINKAERGLSNNSRTPGGSGIGVSACLRLARQIGGDFGFDTSDLVRRERVTTWFKVPAALKEVTDHGQRVPVRA